MLKCSECQRDLPEKEALVNKNEEGEQRIICPECFQKLTGVDYKTFAFRKENAKQTSGLCSSVWALRFTPLWRKA